MPTATTPNMSVDTFHSVLMVPGIEKSAHSRLHDPDVGEYNTPIIQMFDDTTAKAAMHQN
jgi:hypothetical protein